MCDSVKLTTDSCIWRQMTGIRRIVAEFRHLGHQIDTGQLPQLSHLHLAEDDDMFRWRLRIKGFDGDRPAGAALNADLILLQQTHRQDHLLVEIEFPPRDGYPQQPFFMRVVSPRCVMYTGHVTAGGSVCIKALVSGDDGWQSTFSVESILLLVISNMVDCDFGSTQTASGTVADTGPLRIALHPHPLREYSRSEAIAAFARTSKTHGWSTNSPNNWRNQHRAIIGQGSAGASTSTSTHLSSQHVVQLQPQPQSQPAQLAFNLMHVQAQSSVAAMPSTASNPGQNPARSGFQLPILGVKQRRHGSPRSPTKRMKTGSGSNQLVQTGPSSKDSSESASGSAGDESDHTGDSDDSNDSASGFGMIRMASTAADGLAGANAWGGAFSPPAFELGQAQNHSGHRFGLASRASPSARQHAQLHPTVRQIQAQQLQQQLQQQLHLHQTLPQNPPTATPFLPQPSPLPISSFLVYTQPQTLCPASHSFAFPPTLPFQLPPPTAAFQLPPPAAAFQLPPPAAPQHPSPRPVQFCPSPVWTQPPTQTPTHLPLPFVPDPVTGFGPAGTTASLSPFVPMLSATPTWPHATTNPVQFPTFVSHFLPAVLPGYRPMLVPPVVLFPQFVPPAPPTPPRQPVLDSRVTGLLISSQAPPHWDSWEDSASQHCVKFVVLPLPAGCGGKRGEDRDSLGTEEADQTKESIVESQCGASISEMVHNGFARKDAIAALAHCKHDLVEALMFAFASKSTGGAAAAVDSANALTQASTTDEHDVRGDGDMSGCVTGDGGASTSSFASGNGISSGSGGDNRTGVASGTGGGMGRESGSGWEKMSLNSLLATSLHRRRMKEAEEVACYFERYEGLARRQILCIERIQNHRLLTKYEICKSEIYMACEGVTSEVNERNLWHGTSLENIMKICNTGFDMRVADDRGALGAGNYFAASSSYSINYCKERHRGCMQSPQPSYGPRNYTGIPTHLRLLPSGATLVVSSPIPGLAFSPSFLVPVFAHFGAAVPKMLDGLFVPPGLESPELQHNWRGSRAMLLCRVTLGRVGESSSSRDTTRKPPAGFDSVSNSPGTNKNLSVKSTFAVFENSQALPEYLIHLE